MLMVVVVDAVGSNPSQHCNSLTAGKTAGNFLRLAGNWAFGGSKKVKPDQSLRPKFPT
jgi:hypothetical protein